MQIYISNISGYNGEYYNAATGMVYLRARFYEPAMNRFSQKDIVRGSITAPNSLNRYTYVQNDPVNFIDPSGQSLKSAWNSVKTGVQNAVSAVKTTVSKVTTAVKNTASKVVNSVKNAASTVANAAKSAYNSVTTAVSNVISRETCSSTGASYQASAFASGGYAGSSGGGSYTSSSTVYGPYTSNGSATSYFNSSYQTGKTPAPDAPRIENVAAEALALCKDFGKKALQVSAKIYVEYKSFENGVTAAVIRNLGQPGTDLFGALESLITGKTTIANRMQSSLNAKIHSYEQNSYDKTMFSVGMVTSDVAGIAADILLAIYSGGATAGMKVAAQGKDALVLVSSGAALTELAGVGAFVDAIKNGTNLSNDLSDLFSAIKNNQTPEGSTDSAKDFYEQTKNLPTNERVAAYKEKASEVAAENGWVKDSNMSKRSGHTVYRDTKTGEYYSLDTQHGTFEHISSRGKHIEEVDFELNIVSGADKTGQHDFNIR